MDNVVKNLYDIYSYNTQDDLSHLPTQESVACYKNYLTFMIQCRNNHVVPVAFHPYSQIPLRKVRNIIHKAGKAILHKRIKSTRVIKESLQQQVLPTINKIKNLPVSYYEKELMLEWAEYHGTRTYQLYKRKQIKKFKHLISSKCQDTKCDFSHTPLNKTN